MQVDLQARRVKFVPTDEIRKPYRYLATTRDKARSIAELHEDRASGDVAKIDRNSRARLRRVVVATTSEVSNHILDRFKSFGHIVGNIQVELFFEFHDPLDHIQ